MDKVQINEVSEEEGVDLYKIYKRKNYLYTFLGFLFIGLGFFIK